MATLVLLESLATVIIPQLIYYMQEGNFIFCCLSRRHSFLLVPQIAKAPKQAVCPILLAIIVRLAVGPAFFSTYQSFIMIGIIRLSYNIQCGAA